MIVIGNEINAVEVLTTRKISWIGTTRFAMSSLYQSPLCKTPDNWWIGQSRFGRSQMDNTRSGITWIIVAVFCLWASLFSQTAESASAELIMVEETGCAFCARFNDEIAPIYPNTTEGSIAPLRRINIDKGWPDNLSHIKTESLTPTFILVQDNRELGRLYGYQGDEFFWFLLGELLEKLKPVTDDSKQ